MKRNLFFLILLCSTSIVAEARWYLGALGSREAIDYRNIKNGNVVSDTSGTIQILGVGGGFTSMAPGAFGIDLGLGIEGTNSEKLNPNPDWGTPWYYRVTGQVNYSFSFGLFFHVGAEILGSFYQDVESHYLGLGALYGFGYRINDNVSVSLTGTNSSILFSGDNNRVQRGEVLELNYMF
jgi:hypothetical protein